MRSYQSIAANEVVSLDGVLNSVVKGCSEISASLLKFIINSNLFTQTFSAAGAKQSLFRPLIKGNNAPDSNYSSISILSTFYKGFDFVIYEFVSY
jgi:hypothetical protein